MGYAVTELRYSFMVNLTHVRAIKKRIGGRNDYNLLLNGIEKEIPISRPSLRALREALESVGKLPS